MSIGVNNMKVKAAAGLIAMAVSGMTWAIDQTAEIYILEDQDLNKLTFLTMQNDGLDNGGMCFENGDLEWFTDNSCSGNSAEMTLTGTTNHLGLGTESPLSSFHIVETFPSIRLEDSNAPVDAADFYVLGNNNGEFQLRQESDVIMNVSDGENCYGCFGFGTVDPVAPLHVHREDETSAFLFLRSDAPGGPQDRPMMYLANNGGIRFEFANLVQGTAWRFQAATGNADRFEIAKVGTGQIELALDAAGNLEIQGTLMEMSDRDAKERVTVLEGETVLQRLKAVPVSEWSYTDTPESRHIGPMAQDFHAAFGLGRDDRHIAARDMAGVNMAAIQAQQVRIEALESRYAELQAQFAEMKVVLARTIDELDASRAMSARLTAAR